MNPLDELARLTSLFSGGDQLIARCEHVPAATVPEPYQSLLVHDHHMTVTMEKHHGCPVDVCVLEEHQSGEVYARQIVLLRSRDGLPVQFGIVQFDFQYVTQVVRNEILAGQTPLGRVLIEHNVLRHIDLGALLRVEAGPELAQLLRMPEGGVTFGRLATIFCNRKPAVDLLEISAPLP